MLITIPLGLFIFSVVLDILSLATGIEAFAVAAFYNIAGGVIGGLLAGIFGIIDFLSIPTRTRAKTIGTWHLFGNLIVLLLFSLSWLFRVNSGPGTPPFLGVAFSILGLVLGMVTSWLGGELVERLGVGVDPGAHLNAPTSLSDRPVSATRPAMVQAPMTGSEKIEDEP
jgi:uncharacterized membrane protein